MPRTRDLLERFRPAGAPGGATAAGMPADHPADVAAELASLFAALAPTQRECEAIVAAGNAEAAELTARSVEQARALDEATRARLPAERASATARVVARHRELEDATTASRQAELERLLSHGRSGVPDLVAEVLRVVRAWLEQTRTTGGREDRASRAAP